MKPILILILLRLTVFGSGLLYAQNLPKDRTIRVRLERTVGTASAVAGESVTARLTEPLHHNGIVVPAAALLKGRVDFVQAKSVTEDGWMRLLFNRVMLSDGREIQVIALASFFRPAPHGKRDRLLWIPAFTAIGLLAGGHNLRAVGGLGGAIAGVVFVENKTPVGQDLMLHAGQKIRLLLNENSF